MDYKELVLYKLYIIIIIIKVMLYYYLMLYRLPVDTSPVAEGVTLFKYQLLLYYYYYYNNKKIIIIMSIFNLTSLR